MSSLDSRASLTKDFERFKRALPRDFPAHIRETYRIDLSARYLDQPLPHPIGKGSGQLSLNAGQLETDAEAGLAFAVLKTVIAQDASGAQSMAAWAIHETKMNVERRDDGWTVTWKGRGWDRSFDDYVALVRAARDLTRAGRLLAVPSVKYHLPRLDEPFRDAEYAFTTRALAEAWGEAPLLVEKDFSPTLAGDHLSDETGQILRWLREVPARIRAHAPVRLAMKLMNARFDDDFQLEMMKAASRADALVVFNRLFDSTAGVAYGGPELSDRNRRVLARLTPGASPGITKAWACFSRRSSMPSLPSASDLAASKPQRSTDRRVCGSRLLVGSAAHVFSVAARGVSGDRWLADAARAARLAFRPARWPDCRDVGT